MDDHQSSSPDIELLPCPFCGKAPAVDDDRDGVCSVFCSNNDCIGPACICPTRDDAVEFWNTRTPSPSSAGNEQPIAWQVMSAGDGQKYLFYDKGAANLMHKELYDNGWDDVVTTPLYSHALAQPSRSQSISSCICGAASGGLCPVCMAYAGDE